MDIELENLKNEASVLRGVFIDRIIYLERTIDKFLSKHFCKTNELQDELMELVFASENSGFEKKRNLLGIILKRHYIDIFTDSKVFFSKLKSIQTHRNIFAHCMLDFRQDSVVEFTKTNTINFIKYYEKTQTKPYSEKLTKVIFEDLKYCVEFVQKLHRL